jgi:parallel beta-helix repeat protein
VKTNTKTTKKMIKTSQKRELLANALRANSLRVFAAVLVIAMITVSGMSIPSVGRLFGTSTQRVSAATANTINFQARLQNASGAIAPDGSYNVEFKLYSASTGGSALWTEDYLNSATQGVTVRNGYLTVSLGSITALPTTINYDQDLWLTMTVRGTGSCAFSSCTPADAEMSPRLKLTASAYAFRAGQLAQFNSSTGFTSTLQLLQPTGGNQVFQVADQGAAGTYNLLTQNQANTSYIQNQNASAQTSSNFWVSGTGKADTFNATTALQTGGTTRIDASGNLSNIGNISGTGTLQLSGTTGSSYIMSALGLGTTSPQSGSALTIANGQWLSAVDSGGTGYINMFQVNSNNEIQVGAALNVDGAIVMPTDGGQMTFSDLPISTSAAANTPESYTLRVGSSNALTIYGEADGSGNAQNIRVAIGSSIAPAYTLDVGGDVNTTGVYRINGTQICSSTGCTPASGSTNYIQNQSASPQASASFNISGGGTLGGTLTANALRTVSSVDISAAGTLSVGSAVATQVNIAQPGVLTQIRGDTSAQGILTAGGTLATTSNYRLGVTGTMSSSFTGAQYGINNQMSFNPTGAAIANVYGIATIPTISGSALNMSNVYGLYSRIDTTSGYTGTITNAVGIESGAPTIGGNKVSNYVGVQVNDLSSNGGNTSGTLNNYGIRVQGNSASAGAGGTVNNYGAYINVPGGSGGTTNNYGLYLQGNGAGTLSYALYSASTAASLLSGSLTVNAGINSVTGYSFNGTAGSTTTCSSGNVLSNIAVQGGIVTGGTCAANGGGVAPTLQDAYNNSATTTPQIQLTTGNGGLKIRDASTTVGNILQIKDSTGTTTYFAATATGLQAAALDTVTAGTLTLGGTNATGITLSKNVTVAAGQYISLVGGITSSRPASPTEGMLYFDTTTKQLLVYANGKWQADREANTKIVAASNSSQAAKDAADYVADGDTGSANDGDQVQINAALTAAAGGKVYLLEGTYVADATILIPNNTTLAGAGQGTVIEMADIDVSDHLIESSDATTGTGITIQDLKLDGRKDLNTAGIQMGIYLYNMGSSSSARAGANLHNLVINRFSDSGIYLENSAMNHLSDITSINNNHGVYLDTSDGNTLTGIDGSSNANVGILLFAATANTITGNVIGTNAGKGIVLSQNSNNNVVTGNRVYDSGGSTNNQGIYIDNSDSNTVTGNTITDSGAATTNYAINVFNSTSDTNYLANNTLGSGSVNDAGTGTIYAGQQNSNGYFGFKASTSRLGIGNVSPAYALDVSGDINSTTGFRFNGTAGATTTCSGGNVLTNAVVQGGIITGGTCAANGGGSAPTLQNVYDNSGASPVINLGTTGAGIKIQDAGTTVGGSLFSVQNSTGSTKYLSVTTAGIDVAGNITATGTYNGNTFNSNTLTFSGASTTTTISSTGGGLILTGSDGTTSTSITLSSGGAQLLTTPSGLALTVQPSSGLTLKTQNANTLVIDTGTGDLNIGTSNNSAKNINIGNGGTGVKTVTVGSTVATSTTTIQAAGGITLTGAVSASSTINSVSGYKFNGTAGSTTTCSGGNVLSNIVVQGGIVTGGSCATNGGGVSPTLQNVYDNSTSPASILLANGKNFVITAADTATDPNILFNLQCVTSCGSNGRFAVQNAGTDVFAVNPNGTIVVGSGGNTITLSSAGIVLAGTARNAKTIRLSAEYPSAVLDAGTGSNNAGTMTSGYDMTNRMNYYKWTTTNTSTAQTYDIVTQVPIPSDWTAWNGSVISFSVATTSTTNTSAKVEVIDSGNTAASGCNLSPAVTTITPASAPAWATNSTSCSISGGTYTAGDYLTIRIRLSAVNNESIRVGNITLNYLSKF